MTSLQRLKHRLQGFKADGEVFQGQDLRSANAYGAVFTNCKFVECKMNLMNLDTAVLENVEFYGCTGLLSSYRVSSKMRNVLFDSCDLERASFAGSNMDGVTFKESRLAHSSFERSILLGVAFQKCNLRSADLRFHLTKNVSFEDCNLWGAHVSLGCQFFNAAFDVETVRQVIALAARLLPVGGDRDEMEIVAGSKMGVVERLMRDREDE